MKIVCPFCRTEREIEHIEKRLEHLEHTIYGNGQKGLKA